MDSLTELVEDRWRYKILRWFGLIRGPVKNRPLVFVIGATNRPEVLDQALIRPGRLDRMLEVHRPTPTAGATSSTTTWRRSARPQDRHGPAGQRLDDWTPILIKTIINEALIQAHQDGRDFLTYKDWLDAADERDDGIKQPIRHGTSTDRRKTAYHEAGHAVRPLPHARAPDLEGVDHPRGHALGYVQQKPNEERTSLYAGRSRAGSWSPSPASRREPVPRPLRPARRPTCRARRCGPRRYGPSWPWGRPRCLAAAHGEPRRAVPHRRQRAARAAVGRPNARAPEDARRPLRGAGADRARRAHRRGARGSVPRDRGAPSRARRAVRAEAAPVPRVLASAHRAPTSDAGDGATGQEQVPAARDKDGRRHATPWARQPGPERHDAGWNRAGDAALGEPDLGRPRTNGRAPPGGARRRAVRVARCG